MGAVDARAVMLLKLVPEATPIFGVTKVLFDNVCAVDKSAVIPVLIEIIFPVSDKPLPTIT
jgi:hypothetical protein